MKLPMIMARPITTHRLLKIKSPPSDEGLEVRQLVCHDGRQEQQVAEHADLYMFIVSPEADQHGDGNGEQLCEK